jgi:hypothetical protein
VHSKVDAVEEFPGAIQTQPNVGRRVLRLEILYEKRGSWDPKDR